MKPEFIINQVTDHTVIGNHESGRSNAGAILLNDCIAAIDCTMWPRTAKMFRNALETQFKLPVKYLFVTHSHGDHILGLSTFKDIAIFGWHGLQETIPHRIKTQWTPDQMLDMKNAHPEIADWIDEVEFIIPPLLFYNQMEIVQGEQKIEFHHSGGHTCDSAWVYFPAEKVLFAGDLIFSNWFPFAGDDSCDPDKWMETLQTWLEMPIEKVIPGHGPVMGKEIIQKTLTLFTQLKQNTLEVLSKQETPEMIIIPDIFEITDDIQWIINRTINHWFKFYANRTA